MKNQVLEKNKHAAIYIRVSTTMQIKGDSLGSQTERLIARCKSDGFKKYEIYEDAGESAKSTDRPALKAMFKDIDAGSVNSVYVAKMDRISRSTVDLWNLVNRFDEKGVNFVSLAESIDTHSALGRFQLTLLGSLAQLEREVTAERVATDMKHRAEQGKWNGGVVPYGYTTQSFLTRQLTENGKKKEDAQVEASRICPDAKKLIINESEAEVVRWIYKTYMETNSIRKTTTILSDLGIKTRKGEWWASTSIDRMLKNPIYIGKICYGKRTVHPTTGKLVKQDKEDWIEEKGDHEPIISNELFDLVQAQLKNDKMKPTRKGRPYLLTGILRCGICGGSMNGHTTHKKGNKKAYAYYQCVNRRQKGTAACEGLNLPVDAFEYFIVRQLMDLSSDQTFLKDKEKMITTYREKIDGGNTISQVSHIDEALTKAQTRLNRLLDGLERGLIDEDDYKRRYKDLKTEIAGYEMTKHELAVQATSEDIVIQKMELSFEEIASFGRDWDKLDDRAKSLRIKAIVNEVRATKEAAEMDVFLELCHLSCMDRDSSQQPA